MHNYLMISRKELHMLDATGTTSKERKRGIDVTLQ